MIALGCPKGHSLSLYEQFCTKCGAKAEPLPRCICGQQLWPQDNFCGYCGAARPQEEKP